MPHMLKHTNPYISKKSAAHAEAQAQPNNPYVSEKSVPQTLPVMHLTA